MKYVLDASVAVSALRAQEPGHTAARARCDALFKRQDEIVVPVLFDVEISSALIRRGAPPAVVATWLCTYFAGRTLVTIGPRATAAILVVAAQTRLCAMDAAYVWVAQRKGLTLVTSDIEILNRAMLVGVNAVAP